MEAAGRPGGEAEPLTHCVTSSKPFTSLGLVLQGSLRENGALGAGGGGSARADPFLCPQSQDAGTYTCTAKNSVGHARRRVHLTILALPVFTTLPGDRSLRIGDRLWLRCAARGSPPPRIGWTVNDRPVMGLALLGAGGMGPGTLGEGQTWWQDPTPWRGRGCQSAWWVLGLQTWPCVEGTEKTCVWLYVTGHMSDLARNHL